MTRPRSTRLLLIRDIWHSRIGQALRGLMLLQAVGILGLWVLGRLHQHGLLEPPLPPGEEWSLFDCFYFTTIALTTGVRDARRGPSTGLSAARPRSPAPPRETPRAPRRRRP